MDAIAGLLDGPRARGAFLLRSVLEPPFCLSIEDEAPLTVVAVVSGSAWIGDVQLQAGDVGLCRGPEHYTVADDPATAVQAIIDRDQRCHSVDGVELGERWSLGVRTWGNADGGSTVLLTGTYTGAGDVSGR